MIQELKFFFQRVLRSFASFSEAFKRRGISGGFRAFLGFLRDVTESSGGYRGLVSRMFQDILGAFRIVTGVFRVSGNFHEVPGGPRSGCVAFQGFSRNLRDFMGVPCGFRKFQRGPRRSQEVSRAFQ